MYVLLTSDLKRVAIETQKPVKMFSGMFECVSKKHKIKPLVFKKKPSKIWLWLNYNDVFVVEYHHFVDLLYLHGLHVDEDNV